MDLWTKSVQGVGIVSFLSTAMSITRSSVLWPNRPPIWSLKTTFCPQGQFSIDITMWL